MDFLISKPLISKSDFYFNFNIAKNLDNIINECKKSGKFSEIPNMLFYGANGCGKHSVIDYFIYNLFDCKSIGSESQIFTYEKFEITIKSVEYEFKLTPYFLLIDNSNLNNDKLVIQTIIKKYVMNRTIDDKLKFIIIDNVDKLSYYSQMSLRRTMEIYNKECKFILISENKENILKPLISRCINFRICKPTNTELNNLLDSLISEYSLKLSEEQKKLIIEKSDNKISEFYILLNYEIFGLKNDDKREQIYDNILDVLFDNELTNFEFIRSNILELIKYGDSINEIIDKINSYIYSKIEDKDKIDRLNNLNKKLNFKISNTDQDYTIINLYVSEVLIILSI